MTNLEIIRKKIMYRSTHRGTKEMDLLLGAFVKTNINKFNEIDLVNLQDLLLLEDETLYKWYFENIPNKKIVNNKISRMLKAFQL